MSKAKFAQRWPFKLVRAILDGICLMLDNKSKTYAFPKSSEPSFCPGCIAHARKTDVRHNRHHVVCRFPFDEGRVWLCPACVRHKSSVDCSHTLNSGECQWSEAPRRQASTRRQTAPPKSKTGNWIPLESKYMISHLDHVRHKDGWNMVAQNYGGGFVECPTYTKSQA